MRLIKRPSLSIAPSRNQGAKQVMAFICDPYKVEASGFCEQGSEIVFGSKSALPLHAAANPILTANVLEERVTERGQVWLGSLYKPNQTCRTAIKRCRAASSNLRVIREFC